MPLFAFRAKTPEGAWTSGTLTAETERAAVEHLTRMGVFPVEIRPKAAGAAVRIPRLEIRRARARRSEVAAFLTQLADLLRAGVPLLRALETLGAQARRHPLGPILARVGQEVARGRALHEALAEFPREFPRLVVSIVRAGEAGGFLDEALRRIGGFLDREVELRARVAGALAYPVLLLTIGTGAVAFLLAFFIPRFTAIFEQLRAGDLPWITRAVIATGGFVREHGLVLLAALAAAGILLRVFGRTARGRQALESARLAVPLLGEITRLRMVARFARTLGALMRNGVPLVEALEIARDALDSAVYGPAMEEVISGVRRGRRLVEGLAAIGLFPADALDMIAVGEEAATLPEVLETVADAYERRADRTIRTLVTLLEPVLLVVMAAIVGTIVVAMLLPVFTMSSSIR
jgi:general secretion pathway protein F/type IV pilus assembly protein PilC